MNTSGRRIRPRGARCSLLLFTMNISYAFVSIIPIRLLNGKKSQKKETPERERDESGE